MVDERLTQLLGRLDEPVPPDQAFGEALYQRIAPLALAAGRRDRTWLGRARWAIRSITRPMTSPSPAMLRNVIVLATLLALLLALAAIIGSRSHDPNRIVLGSEAVYRDAPAFDMTVGYSDGGVRRFRYDGEAAMRVDVVQGTYRTRREGTFFLADGRRGRIVEWDPIADTATIESLPAGMRPLAPLDLRWGADLFVSNRFASACLDWEYVEESTVVGRAAHHVRCSSGRHEEYWVDVLTGFVLRSTDVPTDDDDTWLTGEVRSLVIGGPIDAAAFAVDDEVPRSGARMPGGNTRLEAGIRVISNGFTPAFVATPGAGWRSWGSTDGIVGFVRGPDWNGADGGAVLVVRMANVTDVATGRDRPLAPGPDAVLDWLRGHPYFDVGPVEQTRVGAVAAQSVTFTEIRPADFDATCPLPSAEEEAASCWRWFPQGPGYWYYGSADHGATATVLDVAGTTITILSWAEGPDEAAHLRAIDDLLATIEFFD
jgi:hypothetical protein